VVGFLHKPDRYQNLPAGTILIEAFHFLGASGTQENFVFPLNSTSGSEGAIRLNASVPEITLKISPLDPPARCLNRLANRP